ncbi:MAG: hypothetical protein ACHP79_11520, partial [Terriglobales bacterium]
MDSDEPSLVLEGLATGIDNLRHDVYLSPKFTEAARQQIYKLVAKHGNVEELLAEERTAGRMAARSQRPATRQSDPAEFKRLLTELHVVSLNRAKAESNVALDLLFRLAVLKFQRTELLNQYGQVLERCRARVKFYEAPRQSGTNRTLEIRERLAGFQINKKTVLRRAGQDLFVLLREARDLAMEAQRPRLVVEAINEIDKWFVIDVQDMKLKLLTTLSQSPVDAVVVATGLTALSQVK